MRGEERGIMLGLVHEPTHRSVLIVGETDSVGRGNQVSSPD